MRMLAVLKTMEGLIAVQLLTLIKEDANSTPMYVWTITDGEVIALMVKQ